MREKEVKQLLINFSQRFGVDIARFFGSSPTIELVNAKGAEIYIVNGKPLAAKSEGLLFPSENSKPRSTLTCDRSNGSTVV